MHLDNVAKFSSGFRLPSSLICMHSDKNPFFYSQDYYLTKEFNNEKSMESNKRINSNSKEKINNKFQSSTDMIASHRGDKPSDTISELSDNENDPVHQYHKSPTTVGVLSKHKIKKLVSNNFTIEKLKLMTNDLMNNFKEIKLMPNIGFKDYKEKIIFMGEQHAVTSNKILFLDLDDTLVHIIKDEKSYYGIILDEKSVNQITYIDSDEIFSKTLKVVLRPFLNKLLSSLSKVYEIAVFTASRMDYANAILSLIDPQKKFIHHVFNRNSCICKRGRFIKCLNIFSDRCLDNMILVDNSVISFYCNMNHGIHINSFEGDKRDSELLKLRKYIKEIASSENVEKEIKMKFKIEELYFFYLQYFD